MHHSCAESVRYGSRLGREGYRYNTQTTGLFEVAEEGATASPALGSILALMAMVAASEEDVYARGGGLSRGAHKGENQKGKKRECAETDDELMLRLLDMKEHMAHV